jgi:signal transduction histidine kinase
MAERVSILGGEFNLRTAPHQGTVITVQVKAPHEEDTNVQNSRAVGG